MMQSDFFQTLYNNHNFHLLIYSRIGGRTNEDLKADIFADVYTYIFEHVNAGDFPTYEDYARYCNRVVNNQLKNGKIGRWYRAQMGWQNNNRIETQLKYETL